MNYDLTNIPAAYDKARALSDEALSLWMMKVAKFVEADASTRILDLGCGTGRFTQALADHFSASVVGVDPSQKMLAQAAAKAASSSVRYVSGSGESIPLPDADVDLVFISMVFHHFNDPDRVARECRRVTTRSGKVFVRTGMVERIHAYAYVDFFPETLPILRKRLPTCSLIQRVFEAAGFCTMEAGTLTQTLAPTYAAYADKLAAGGDSILAELSAAEFQRGLDALRAFALENDPQQVSEPVDYVVFTATPDQ